MLAVPMFQSDKGFLYDPILDSWQAVTEVMFLGRVGAAAVWAGSRFVIWGGVRIVLPGDDGLVLQP